MGHQKKRSRSRSREHRRSSKNLQERVVQLERELLAIKRRRTADSRSNSRSHSRSEPRSPSHVSTGTAYAILNTERQRPCGLGSVPGASSRPGQGIRTSNRLNLRGKGCDNGTRHFSNEMEYSRSDSPKGDGQLPSELESRGFSNYEPYDYSARDNDEVVEVKENNTHSSPSGETVILHEDVNLSEDVLDLLGTDPEEQKPPPLTFHPALSRRWSAILSKGLSKEEQTALLEKIQIPDNCKLLNAPIMNPEIKPIMSAAVTTRDNCHQDYQTKLGKGLSSIGKALNTILEHNNQLCQPIRDSLLTDISEAGRVLTGLFHNISHTRQYLVLPCLNKQLRDTVENLPPDELLFGANLSERIQELKSLEKVGKDIRPPPQRPKQQIANNSKFNNPRKNSTYSNSLNRHRPTYQRREGRSYKGQTFTDRRDQRSSKDKTPRYSSHHSNREPTTYKS